MNKETQKIDLLISHSQIHIRAGEFNEILCKWGKKNIEQGVIIHESYVVFDPLPDDTFGAIVELKKANKFEGDSLAQRRLLVPFYIPPAKPLQVASANDMAKIELDLPSENYELYYEICEGDEVYYKITFVSCKYIAKAVYLLDDPWGGRNGHELKKGYA